MKPLVIDEDAEDELDEAIRYYETKRRGLGVDLASKVSDTFLRIQRNPRVYPYHKETRIQSVWSDDSPTRSFTWSLMITSQSLLLRTRSVDPTIGNLENRNDHSE